MIYKATSMSTTPIRSKVDHNLLFLSRVGVAELYRAKIELRIQYIYWAWQTDKYAVLRPSFSHWYCVKISE